MKASAASIGHGTSRNFVGVVGDVPNTLLACVSQDGDGEADRDALVADEDVETLRS